MTGGFGNGKRTRRDSNNRIVGNPFEMSSPSTAENRDSTELKNRDSTELRISNDPKKLLALLAAFVGLFTNHSKDDVSSGSGGQDPPNKILTDVAILLGLSAAAAANGDATPPVNGSIAHRRALQNDGEEEEEDGNPQRLKKQKRIRDSDAGSTCEEVSIPDSSYSTPPPPKSGGLGCGDSTGYSPVSAVSSASLDDIPKTTRSAAASIDLLNLVNASIQGLEEIGKRARLGVTLLEEGQKKVNEAKHILFSAINEEIPNRIK